MSPEQLTIHRGQGACDPPATDAGPKPLTLLTPVPWWWTVWVRLTWRTARWTDRIARPLRDLSFIHFGHWSLVDRWPVDRAARRDRAAARSLLFVTTFDGSNLQYIDAFVRVVPGHIRGLYGHATGFPGARRYGPVRRYVDRHTVTPPTHFWCAYPHQTTRTISQALELRGRLAAFERRVEGADASRFAREWRRFLADVQELL